MTTNANKPVDRPFRRRAEAEMEQALAAQYRALAIDDLAGLQMSQSAPPQRQQGGYEAKD